MDVQPLDLARWVLLFSSLALIIFTTGALVGWRLASPAERHEPTWLFLMGELSGLPLIAMLFLVDHPPGWEWLAWLPPAILALWSVAFVLRIRARRRVRL